MRSVREEEARDRAIVRRRNEKERLEMAEAARIEVFQRRGGGRVWKRICGLLQRRLLLLQMQHN